MGAQDITDLKSFIENYEELKKINAQKAIEDCFAHLKGNMNLIKDIKDKQRGGNVRSGFGARNDDVMAIQHLSEILFRDMQPHIVNPKSKISLAEFNKVIEGIGYKPREPDTRRQPILPHASASASAPKIESSVPFAVIKIDQELKAKHLAMLDKAILATNLFQSTLKEPSTSQSLVKLAKKAIFSDHKTKAELAQTLLSNLERLRKDVNTNQFSLTEFDSKLTRILKDVEKDYGKRVQVTHDNKELLNIIKEIRNENQNPHASRKQTKR